MTGGRAHIEPISCTAVPIIRTVRSPNEVIEVCYVKNKIETLVGEDLEKIRFWLTFSKLILSAL